MSNMKRKVEAQSFGDNEPLPVAIGVLLMHAMSKGVTHVGEKMTILVPPMDVGTKDGPMVSAGEWELVLTKVAD